MLGVGVWWNVAYISVCLLKLSVHCSLVCVFCLYVMICSVHLLIEEQLEDGMREVYTRLCWVVRLVCFWYELCEETWFVESTVCLVRDPSACARSGQFTMLVAAA